MLFAGSCFPRSARFSTSAVRLWCSHTASRSLPSPLTKSSSPSTRPWSKTRCWPTAWASFLFGSTPRCSAGKNVGRVVLPASLLTGLKATEGANSSNTLAFALSIKCDAKRGTARLPAEQKFGMEPDLLYTNHEVFSGDFVFRPFGDQSETFAPPNAPAPVHDDILLAKLRPGQQIVCEAHCEKGIARDHAKWSAVGESSYIRSTGFDSCENQPRRHIGSCPLLTSTVQFVQSTAGSFKAASRPASCRSPTQSRTATTKT
jgi:hypothetical protein